jgi:hypothetical protein
VQEVQEKLKENIIDGSRMVNISTSHCNDTEFLANKTYLVRKNLPVPDLNVQVCAGIGINLPTPVSIGG